MRAMNDDGTMTIGPDEPTPDEKMKMFDAAVTGQADHDVSEIVMAMMEDVRDSAMLSAYNEFLLVARGTIRLPEEAARTISSQFAMNIGMDVDDFLTNTYGDL